MVYILNLFFTIIYSYYIRKIKSYKIIYFLPIIMTWSIILGFQYEVGTDYQNYLSFFYGKKSIILFYNQKEYLFYYFMKYCSKLFSNGQIIFLLIGIGESILFILFTCKCQKNKILGKNLHIYMFLYLGYATIFYNQMNGLRQYFTIYLFTLSILFILKKDLKNYLIISIIGMSIHRSYYLLLPFYFIYLFILKKIEAKKFYHIIMIIAIIFSIIDIHTFLEKVIIDYVPTFGGYFSTDLVKSIEFKNKIIKYLYIPFYLLSINLIGKYSERKLEFLKLGIIGYVVRIATLNLEVVARIGEYFILISIFPIYYLIEEWIKRKKIIFVVSLLSMMLVLFLLKVTILAVGEYEYHSYLFN